MEWMKWIFHLFTRQTTKGINQNDIPVTPQQNKETLLLHRAVANYSLTEISVMLDSGIDIEMCDKNGLSPLQLAIKRNFVTGIHLLLEKGASVNVRDKEGCTPLHFAVLTRNFHLVKSLVNKGAESKETDKYGITSLHLAAYNKDWDSFDVLLHSRKQGVSKDELEVELLKRILSREYEVSEESGLSTLVHLRNDENETPLHIAVRKSKLNLVGMLLDFGAETEARDNLGRTALHIAVETESYEIVKLLIDRGANVNIISDNQEHLLFSTIRNRNLKILLELLMNGANIEVRHTDRNKTPLIVATSDNLTPEVELLLERGADVNVTDSDDYMPLDYVIRNENFKLVQKLLDNGARLVTTNYPDNSAIYEMFSFDMEQTVSLILKNKLDVNMKDYYGNTPLHWVMCNGALVELLLNNGANIEAEDSCQNTPLLTAMRNNPLNDQDKKGIEMLMKRGANLNVQNYDGKTLLHFALTNRCFVKTLLDKGADIEARDNTGKTPIFSTINNDDGAESCLETILNYGAKVNVQDTDGKTPLHYAACLENPTLLNILLSHEADLEVKDNEGQTPFFYAVVMHYGEFKDNNDSIISLLIEKGTPVNSINIEGRTVLFYEMNNELMKKLLKSGADVTIKDNNGQTALHLAMTMYYGGNIYAVIDHLIEKGANLLSQDNQGITPLQILLSRMNLVPGRLSDIKPLLFATDNTRNTLLHFGVNSYLFNFVKHVLDIGVHVDSKNIFEETSIHLAVLYPICVKIAKELLKRGAAINIQDNTKETPLHKAAIYDNQDLIKDLLIKGARMDIENSNGNTPLQVYHQSEPQNNKMIEHIVILRTANLHDDITCSTDSLDFSAFDSFKESCLKELRRLEEYKINFLSLIDVFRKFEDPLFVSSSEFKDIITSPILEQQFPIYGPYLKVKFDKAELRNSLLDSAMCVVDCLMPRDYLIPNEIKRKILSKLSNEDLLYIVD